MPLEKYRKKRHFERTPEPSGAKTTRRSPGGNKDQPDLLYVIHKHSASRLHYDLRLELDGVLLSWAVPKGPSLDPRDRHLAARVEDHPLEYGGFEGTIPKGEYGAGTVEIWDRGTWIPEGDPHKGLARGDLKFTLYGEKLKGSWVLVRMKPRPGSEDKENWLLIKHRDDEAVDKDGSSILEDQPRSVASGRTIEEITAGASASVWHSDQPAEKQTEARRPEDFRIDPEKLEGARKVERIPRFVAPQLTTLVKDAPVGDRWLHEVKFDGYRAVSHIEKGSASIYSRNDKDWTSRYQVLAEELAELPIDNAVLDGEVVVQLPDGTTNFQELQNVLRANGGKNRDGEAAAGRLLYYVFDLLYVNGYELLASALEDRKELLGRVLARAGKGGRIQYSSHLEGNGPAVFAQACKMGLEGVVSKRAGSRYSPGVRGGDWIKTKCRLQQEFIIGGFTDPAGSRTGFGALHLGVWDDMKGKKQLKYVGKVGTGFSEKLLRQLEERLKRLEIDDPPFAKNLPRTLRGSHWVRPQLVGEVAFTEWTKDGAIRHPSFQGLREDKPAMEVIAEVPEKVVNTKSRTSSGRDDPTQSAGDAPPKEATDAPDDDLVNGVALTHPDRVFWPLEGITKRDLAAYYDRVADKMLPYVVGRPVAMVRCPGGIGDLPAPVRQGRSRVGDCFFHKHPGDDFPGPFAKVTIKESGGPAPYLTITEAGSLTAMAQMGVLEIHIWGSTWPDIDHPDLIVFDLDPDPSVQWPLLADAARRMRRLLSGIGLESFVKTTGGKGLHVVVPVTPSGDWSAVRLFCKGVADAVVREAPERFTANMLKAKRGGKIYVDYVRNTRGSTSIAPYSTRAKERATVAVPLRWTELNGKIRPDTYTIKSLPDRLRRLGSDPWEGYLEAQRSQSIAPEATDAVTTFGRERT
ncbi:MAG: DNA ligase D [Actinobacteria bacterium]|nr:DNA ligase D [Actinomycetota bacterium]